MKVCYRKTCTKCFFKTIFRSVLLVSFYLIINNELLLFNFGEWQDESKTLADMKRVWISKKFSYIYEACPSTNLAFFMQSVYAHCIGYMASTVSLSHRLGGLYCLYCLYETQPFKPPFKVYISLGMPIFYLNHNHI